MAARGRKPKPTHLHVVDGTARTTRMKARQGEPEPGGQPVAPKRLRKREQELWDQYIATAWWLTEHDSVKAHVFVCLYAEFERKPSEMTAARIAQLRAAGSELGMDPASRTRLGGPSGRKPSEGQAKSPEEEFFGAG